MSIGPDCTLYTAITHMISIEMVESQIQYTIGIHMWIYCNVIL